MNPLCLKKIAYIGSWKHFFFSVYVCIFLFVSICLSHCHHQMISFQKIYGFYGLEHHTVEINGDVTLGDIRTDTHVNIVLEFCEVWTEFAKMKMSSILIFLCKMFLKWISWFDLAAILWHFQRKRFGFDLICWKYILWHLFLSFPSDRVVFSIFEPNFGENWMGRAKNLTNI